MSTFGNKEIEKKVWAAVLAGIQEEYDLSTGKMAKIMDCSPSTVSKMMSCAETRIPTLTEMISLCHGAGMNALQFLQLTSSVLTEKEGGIECSEMAKEIANDIRSIEDPDLYARFDLSRLSDPNRKVLLHVYALMVNEDSRNEKEG